MGRKRWRERRQPARSVVTPYAVRTLLDTPQTRPVIRCGYPFGDGSMCMTPAGVEHVHEEGGFISVAGRGAWYTPPTIDEEQERRETEDLLNRADRMVPAKGLAEAISSYLVDDVMPLPFEYTPGIATEHANYRRPTYDVLKAASAERARFTTEQAQSMLSAALGTRPHLAARVIDKLGPVLAGELARAVDTAVESRITGYLSAERAELNRLYADQSTKLQAEREQRGRGLNDERWKTPSRLA